MSEVFNLQISEEFIRSILQSNFPDQYQTIYDNSFLLQYLDLKMRAIHRDSKARRSFANIYAIYSILYFYQSDFYGNKAAYQRFEGYDYMQLFSFFRNLYGGSKLQNHALNSRVNSEFRNRFPNASDNLILSNGGKYLIHINYLYVGPYDISRVSCQIIEEYIRLISAKDRELLQTLHHLVNLTDYTLKRNCLCQLLHENAEARIFEIISFSILKNHYETIKVYWGYSPSDLYEDSLHLYKTGRTNANDGGIDFVMRPVGRFFQVTETDHYDKYLLDIDKVMHFPITFVIKTLTPREIVLQQLETYIHQRSGGMLFLEQNYRNAIEDIITINELRQWIFDLSNEDIDQTIRDIDHYYKLEMQID